MLRIICHETDYELTQVNGACHESIRTFDVEAPTIEAWLASAHPWIKRSLVAVEYAPAPPSGAGREK